LAPKKQIAAMVAPLPPQRALLDALAQPVCGAERALDVLLGAARQGEVSAAGAARRRRV
jgi:hypothetical protein